MRIREFDFRQDNSFYSSSVAKSVLTRGVSEFALPSVDEVKECRTCVAIKIRRRGPGRDGKIIRDHTRKEHNVTLSDVCKLLIAR